MEETDVSLQIYTFLEVTAVCYGQKPVKDGQRCDFRDRYHDKKERSVLNQSAGGTIDCMIYVPEICQTFSVESQYSLYSET